MFPSGSFVRSVSMDNWQEDQLKRMEVRCYRLSRVPRIYETKIRTYQLGGNKRFKEFLEQYTPTSVGGYEPGMSKDDKYGCWAAEQYKGKVRLNNVKFRCYTADQ